ncbi:cation diffusion facilitator family transporter [Candidatus Woesearchaeota archaeon]|nr:cation diffusion facilitator family transporter [Candidatus Woesearchaeota archaeon]
MKKSVKRAAVLSLLGNTILFLMKITAGIAYNSIAVISDAINSFTDIIASMIVFISVKVSAKKADEGHPFGHHRAEPIAGLIVAIFIGIVGFEVVKAASVRLLTGGVPIRGIIPVIVITLTLIIKLCMYAYTASVGKKTGSTAILASAADNKGDVIISLAVLGGLGGAYIGYGFLDSLVALLIGFWIIYLGYKIGMDNIKFLIGEAPSKELIGIIKKAALSVDGVRGINDVRAHYVGVLLHVEIHIEVDKRITIHKAHTIGKKVQKRLERKKEIKRAFVHIDPIDTKIYK